MAKTIHQYYFEALGTLATYSAPWQMCKKTLRFLNHNMAMPDIEGEIESQRRARLATSGRFAYPDKSWLRDCIAANCQDTFVLHVYIGLLGEIVSDLTDQGDCEQATELANQLIALFDKNAMGSLPEPVQKTLTGAAINLEARVKQQLIAILRRQGRFDEAIELIKVTPIFSFADSELKRKEIGSAAGIEHLVRKAPKLEETAYRLAVSALASGTNFVEAEEFLEKAYDLMDLRPLSEIAPEAHHKDPQPHVFERVINLYLVHSYYKSARKWHEAKEQKYYDTADKPADLCQKYIDALTMAAILTGLGLADEAETFYKRVLQIARDGGLPQPLLRDKIGPEWLAKTLADYGMFLEKQNRHLDAQECFIEIAKMGLPFEQLFTILLQPSAKKPEDWVRWLPHGYACAAMFGCEADVVARVVDLVSDLIEAGKISCDEETQRQKFLVFSAGAYRDVGRFPAAIQRLEQAIEAVERNLEDKSDVTYHPDHLFDLLNQYTELLEQAGQTEGRNLAQSRLEGLRQKYFRQS